MFDKYKIRKLRKADYEEALELYAKACRTDKFFCRQFKTEDCYFDIKDNFNSDVDNTIAFGHAYGTFHKGKLVGVILGFNIYDWYRNHKAAYDHIFQSDSQYGNSWFETLTTKFRQLNKRIVYVYAICVDRDFQGCRIASNLIQTTVRLFGKDFVLFSDADNPVARSMWLRNGFQQFRIPLTNGGEINGFYRGGD